jgi:hypothetical protein
MAFTVVVGFLLFAVAADIECRRFNNCILE